MSHIYIQISIALPWAVLYNFRRSFSWTLFKAFGIFDAWHRLGMSSHFQLRKIKESTKLKHIVPSSCVVGDMMICLMLFSQIKTFVIFYLHKYVRKSQNVTCNLQHQYLCECVNNQLVPSDMFIASRPMGIAFITTSLFIIAVQFWLDLLRKITWLYHSTSRF